MEFGFNEGRIGATRAKLAFSAAEFRVIEDGTPVVAVTIDRTDGNIGEVSATVSLSNGTATAPEDYNNTPIEVKFASGETQKTVLIPIVNDNLVEGNETVNLTLGNPQNGATIGDRNTAVLRILDNDGSAVLSRTAGTILSDDSIDVFLPPGGELTLEVTVTVPGDGSTPAAVSVSPSSFALKKAAKLASGDTSTPEITFAATAAPPQLPLDVYLLQDASSTFNDDLATFRGLVPNLVNALVNVQPDTTFGLGTFVDKPVLPFGNFADDDYVYRNNLSLTKDTTALQSTVNNLTTRPAGFTFPEAQLEALLQTSLRTGEIGFRNSTRRVVVVATDDAFHQPGDGKEAGITTPNNGDAVLDGNPPGTGEDYPSIEQVRKALIDADIVPIFAVTNTNQENKQNIPIYQSLVNQLGFGKVVQLESDSGNLVDAITEGLGAVGSEINIFSVSDDFGYVKEILPAKFTGLLAGEKRTFTVKLKSDGKGGDDTLILRALGYGDTKVNIRTDSESIKPRIDGKITNTYGPILVPIYIPPKIVSYPVSIRVWQDADGDGKPDQQPNKPVRNVETYVVIHGNQDSPNDGKMAALAKAVNEDVVKKNPNAQVLLIDWSEAAKTLPNVSAEWIHDVAQFAVGALKDTWKIDPKNINLIGHSLGTFVASEIAFLLSNKEPDKVLDSKYRENPNIDPNKEVNTLIALDPAELLGGNLPSSGLYDLDADADGSQIPVKFNSVSSFSKAFYGEGLIVGGGDGLGSNNYAHSAHESYKIDFGANKDAIANHGNIVYLFKNIIESKPEKISSLFQLDKRENGFKQDTYNVIDGRGDEGVIVAIASSDKNLTDQGGNDPNSQATLLVVQKADTEGDQDGDVSLGVQEVEPGVFGPVSINLDDEIVYGSTGNDTLNGYDFKYTRPTTVLSGSLNVFFKGGSDLYSGGGDDVFYGDKGNDVIAGDQGNDFLEGDEGNDSLVGGEGNDTIQGDAENDSLFGGSGNDILFGGNGDDVLSGVSNSEPGSAIPGSNPNPTNPGLGEFDTLTGGSSSFSEIPISSGKDLFILGNFEEFYYDDGDPTTSGISDYALITDFFPREGDIIQLKAGNYYLDTPRFSFLPSGTAIYLDDDGTPGFSDKDELIAIVQGTSLPFGSLNPETPSVGFQFGG